MEQKCVMERELRSQTFRFLLDPSTADHRYYRWRVYSLSQGDSLKTWRASPFQMVMGGPFWIPPVEKIAPPAPSPPAAEDKLKDHDEDSSRRKRTDRDKAKTLRSRDREELEETCVSPRVLSCRLVCSRVASCALVSSRVASCALVSSRVASCALVSPRVVACRVERLACICARVRVLPIDHCCAWCVLCVCQCPGAGWLD